MRPPGPEPGPGQDVVGDPPGSLRFSSDLPHQTLPAGLSVLAVKAGGPESSDSLPDLHPQEGTETVPRSLWEQPQTLEGSRKQGWACKRGSRGGLTRGLGLFPGLVEPQNCSTPGHGPLQEEHPDPCGPGLTPCQGRVGWASGLVLGCFENPLLSLLDRGARLEAPSSRTTRHPSPAASPSPAYSIPPLPHPTSEPEVHCLQDIFAAPSLLPASCLHLQNVPRLAQSPSHPPPAISPSLTTETVRAMTHVINQGMAMYWGTSRWSSMEIMEAYSVARQFNLTPPICEQAEYHMFQREKVEVQLPELFHKIGVGAMTWSPLACGIVSGKYDSGIPPYSRASLKVKERPVACFPTPNQGYQWLKDKILSEEGRRQQAKLKELQALAERLGCTLPQLAIAWCLRNEGVSSVLLGASNADQLMENIGAIQVLPKLSSSIIHEIDSILGNKPYSKKDYRS
ncbi:hypothetical protein P7K49_015312 [Saguinus oedipus]|uniref:NADP-dependent oxidoreductase domain-containing protein n=1 Tax=Saguinus oedipus TaxID=9490 RepID=A0ABQ9V8X0_SAGOE|nr:hypothetical protein P7K49_015312 [Saguinus oedipus]